MPSSTAPRRAPLPSLVTLALAVLTAWASPGTVLAQQSLAELLALVRDQGDRVSAQVFTRIAGYRSEESLRTLQRAVDEVRSEWALNAAYGAFARYGGELRAEAVEYLGNEARRNRRDENQRAAARALGAFGADAQAELETLLGTHRSAEVRRLVAAPLIPMLGERGGAEAVATILEYAEVESGRGRAAAHDALARCQGPAVDALLAAQLRARGASEAWKLLVLDLFAARSGGVVDEALVAALEQRSPLVRTRAIELIGRRGDRAALRAVRARLNSEDDAEVREAILAVARLSGADERWARELLELSRSRRVAARLGAAAALLEARTEEAVRRLHEMLADEDWRVRATAIREVGNLHRAASVPILIARLDAEDGRLRRDLAQGLRLMTGEDHGTTATRWRAWWSAEGAGFRLPPYEEALALERERAERRRQNLTVATFYGLEVVSERVAFVLDTSGSMQAAAGTRQRTRTPGSTGPTRLDVAKQELERALRGIPPGVRFNVVFFENGVDAWRDALVEKDERSLEEALEFARRQRAAGGTNVYDALLAALDDPLVDTIYVLSDGDPTAGTVIDPSAILRRIAQLNRTRLVQVNAISIGQASPFLQRLAEENGGVYAESL